MPLTTDSSINDLLQYLSPLSKKKLIKLLRRAQYLEQETIEENVETVDFNSDEPEIFICFGRD